MKAAPDWTPLQTNQRDQTKSVDFPYSQRPIIRHGREPAPIGGDIQVVNRVLVATQVSYFSCGLHGEDPDGKVGLSWIHVPKLADLHAVQI